MEFVAVHITLVKAASGKYDGNTQLVKFYDFSKVVPFCLRIFEKWFKILNENLLLGVQIQTWRDCRTENLFLMIPVLLKYQIVD